MRLLTVLICLGLSASLSAQVDTSLPFKKFPGIAPFDLLKTDSLTHLTKADINVKHKTMLMFFSPDCSHCQHQTEDMLAGIDSLKDIQIIMATYQPFEEMVAFNKKYALEKYSNIQLGRDTKFFLVPYYGMKSLPFLALYDKKGNYIVSYEGNQKVAKLVADFEGKK